MQNPVIPSLPSPSYILAPYGPTLNRPLSTNLWTNLLRQDKAFEREMGKVWDKYNAIGSESIFITFILPNQGKDNHLSTSVSK